MKRKLFVVLIISFLLSCSLNVGAVVDYDAVGSVTADLHYKDLPLPDSTLTVYDVGDLVWEDGEYRVVLCEELRESGLPLTDLHTNEVAALYDRSVREHHLQGVTKTADENGRVVFESLPVGIYLVSDFHALSENLVMDPFLVTVPMLVDDEFVYTTNATPKVSVSVDFSEGDRPEAPENPNDDPENDVEFPTQSTTVTTTKPSGGTVTTDTPDDSEKIPQTGQLKWPVPVLASSGVCLVFVGWWMVLDREKKHHET